jgi:hypothetical protein
MWQVYTCPTRASDFSTKGTATVRERLIFFLKTWYYFHFIIFFDTKPILSLISFIREMARSVVLAKLGEWKKVKFKLLSEPVGTGAFFWKIGTPKINVNPRPHFSESLIHNFFSWEPLILRMVDSLKCESLIHIDTKICPATWKIYVRESPIHSISGSQEKKVS